MLTVLMPTRTKTRTAIISGTTLRQTLACTDCLEGEDGDEVVAEAVDEADYEEGHCDDDSVEQLNDSVSLCQKLPD
jgi:hypothetical protein